MGNTGAGLQKNLSFPLSPAACAPSDWLVLLVSSRPRHQQLRAGWRAAVADSGAPGLRLVFMVARSESEEDQARLAGEQQQWGDILQPDTRDGHRRLGYKAAQTISD